jgi:hypothetical protein
MSSGGKKYEQGVMGWGRFKTKRKKEEEEGKGKVKTVKLNSLYKGKKGQHRCMRALR